MKKYETNKKGISLVVLVITIVVIVILATAIILSITQGGVVDSAKKAKFMNSFRNVQEGVDIYSMSKINASNPYNYVLPVNGKLTLSDKEDIKNNVPTLNTKIEELNPGKTIDDIDIYWINAQEAGIQNIPAEKKDKGYIIDAATRQIYDYYGDVFEGLRWHTLDSGVADTGVSTPPVTEEMWNGWIKLTLYYPSSSTARQWRLGKEGETRSDPMLMWQDYTGPITVPLDRVKDVWIKYKLNGKDVIIPPAGTLLVDIEPDKTGTTLVDKVNVTINYDYTATTKEYRIGNSGWMPYTGPFVVTENCIVEARAKKTENIYNTDGSLLMSRDIAGSDKVYIGNIGVKPIETTLPAPTITRLDPQSGDEKARVQVTYPSQAVTRAYTVNYGEEQTYTDTISVKTYGTYIVAYYYDASGKKSNETSILINDPSTGTPATPTPHEPLPPSNPKIPEPGSSKYYLPAPTITRLDPQSGDEKARVQIAYPSQAVNKVYVQNGGDEQSYTYIISVKDWGTQIIAYYYDVDGNVSQANWITINPTPTPPEPYPPMIILPEDVIAPPTINIDPNTGIVDAVTVSVSSPATANKTYIKIGRNSDYQEYTGPVVVGDNIEIHAYYTTLDGKKSTEAEARVTNIRKSGGDPTKIKPYVYVDASPYPYSGSYGASKVTVTIKYSDCDKIEYSEDGIVYKSYTGPFDVTKNETVYARGTNVNGVTEDSLDITNIGGISETNHPPAPKILSVNINVSPEPALSTVRVASAKVTIEYDSKATEKYYRINTTGALAPYTGAFDVTSNCTVYAYAKSSDAQGSAAKVIDNLIDGIADPIITASPDNKVQSSKVSISIQYDKYATIKRYSLDGGSLRDYTGPIDITKNGTVVYAYSENIKGQKSSASYTVENIVPEPPTLLLDMGDYYLLKLNYPEGSKGREYKWKRDGTWTSYKDAGILLIKPQFKDKVIQNGTLVKIQDENGNMVTFTGDWYLIDVPINELAENLFMRWDRVTPPAPQIVINPTDPAKQVTATIIYDSTLVKKQYRVVKPGETPGDYQDYTGPITIDKNNTVIYAKGQDDTEVWSSEGMYKVTNIDEVPPVINVTADLTTAQQKVQIKVAVTDDVAVGKVKWAPGLQGESYFATGGTEIANNSIVNISTNGYYTFYAEDKVGNTQVYTLNVTNVDLIPPVIDIAVSPENIVGLNANVTINYGDSVASSKQYKIGTNNATWSNYISTFAISSYTILSNNWQNSDGTVTIYAKGKDAAGNEITVQKKIMNLDLDMPRTPVINSRASYPILTSYGVIFDGTTTITYDTRTDIDNYYSTDNGATWIPYIGSFNMVSGTIIAKSVKKNTGLEVSASKTVAIPTDALAQQAYDGNDSTYISGNSSNKYIQIDNSMQGKTIRVKWYIGANGSASEYLVFLDQNKVEISRASRSVYNNTANNDEIITIPSNTSWMSFTESGSGNMYLYEIQNSNEPTFSATNGYAMLTADPTKVEKEPYQMVTINYFPTSVQRLYQVGSTSGQWLNYNDQPIKVPQGQIIYAKGIDQYGNATRKISSYTANVPDAIGKETLDGNDSTYVVGGATKYMKVDSNIQGKNVRLKWILASGVSGSASIAFLDQNKQAISTLNRSVNNSIGSYDEVVTIPINTAYIAYTANVNGYSYLYEVQLSNEPTFSTTNGYMLFTADPTKAIKTPYQMVTINYFPTSIQRLYQIGSTTGQWLNYSDQPIKVDVGQIIYAKGIDQYGNATRIISSYTSSVSDALGLQAYDGNDTTYVSGGGTNKYMQVDSSMQGKNIRVKWYIGANSAASHYIIFLDQNKTEISRKTRSVNNSTSNNDEIFTIPSNASYIAYSVTGSGNMYLYEIQPANEPTFSATNGYMFISLDALKQIREPYQMVAISYFPTSVQRLYQIGSTTGQWLNYNDQPIMVAQGQIIYAKGIDQYGNATRITSSYTANVTDAVKKEAYDSSDSTYVVGGAICYAEIDSSSQGKSVRFKWSLGSGLSASAYISFLDQNKQLISTITRSVYNNVASYNEMLTIPLNTKYIGYSFSGNGYSYLYEIQP